MSAQNAKKKRIGSRRRAVNQNPTAEDNETSLTVASAAQSSTSGETPEVTEVVKIQDGLTTEASHWPSPEFREGKRKFGSRRKQKILHVGDFATAMHHKEDVEGATEGSEFSETIQASMEIQAQNAQKLSQESEHETLDSTDSHLHAPNPQGDSSECKDSSVRKDSETEEERSHTHSKSLTETHAGTYHFQSEEIWSSSPDTSGLSLSETLKENVQPFLISVDPNFSYEASDSEVPKELFDKECEDRKNDSGLLRQTEDFQGHHFQSESPKVDDSWPQREADLTCSREQKPYLPQNEGSLEDKGQREQVDLQVEGNMISGEAVDRIRVENAPSDKNHDILHTIKCVQHDATGSVAEEAELMFQSELVTDLSAMEQDDSSPVGQEVMHKNMDAFCELEKVDVLSSEVNMTHRQDKDIGPSAEERVLSEMEQSNSSPEVEQDLLLSVPDYNHRFTENAMAKTSSNKPMAATPESSEIETRMQEDSLEPILRDTDPSLAEKPSDQVQEVTQTHPLDDASEHFATDSKMDGIQADRSHFTEILEESSLDASVAKEEELNCDNNQEGHQSVGEELGAFHQTSEERSVNDPTNKQLSGMDRADTEPGGVYKTEDPVDHETPALDSGFEANLDQMQQMDSVSNPAGSRRKLGSSRKRKQRPQVQDTDLPQQPFEQATGNSADQEPLETLTLLSENEVLDGVEEIAHCDTRGDIPELDAAGLLSSPTSNQQSNEMSQALLSMVSAKEGNEQEDSFDLLGQDRNLQLLVSESLMKSTNPTAKTSPENQSDSEGGGDSATQFEEGKDHVNLPEGRGLLGSVDRDGKEVDTPPVENSLALCSSEVDGENMDSTLAENPSDEVKENMQTDVSDAASECFSTVLSMDGMQVDQSHFTEMLEEFSNVHSGTETYGSEKGDLWSNNHSTSASPPVSGDVPATSEIYRSGDSAVSEYGTGIPIVASTKEYFPSEDGKNEVLGADQFEEKSVCDVPTKTNCLESDSDTCRPTSAAHEDYLKGDVDFYMKVSAGSSPADWEKSESHTLDLSSSDNSKTPALDEETEIQASYVQDVSCPIANEITDTGMSELGVRTGTDVSGSKEEELSCENQQDGHHTKGEDPRAFHQTTQVSRRKLGSSRRKKQRPQVQDTDLPQQPVEEATGNGAVQEPLETLTLLSEGEVLDGVKEIAQCDTPCDLPDLDAARLLSSPASNQQSNEMSQGLLSMFSATEGKKREKDSDLVGQDPNQQLLVSESLMKSMNKEASTVLVITTDSSNPENQSDIGCGGDPATQSKEGKDHVNPQEPLCSVGSDGKVHEEVDQPLHENSLVLQGDSSLQSVVEGESAQNVPGEGILLSENTVRDKENGDSSNTPDGERPNTRSEAVETVSVPAVKVDSHPSFENSAGQNIAINQALEEFANEGGIPSHVQQSGVGEIGETAKDPTEKMYVQEKNDERNQLIVQENSREEPSGKVPEEEQQSSAAGGCRVQQTNFDSCDSMQTKEKRRKMGSTRRARFNRKQEDEMRNYDETKSPQDNPDDCERDEEVGEHLGSGSMAEVSPSGPSEAPTNPQNADLSFSSSVQNNPEINTPNATVGCEVNSVVLVQADDVKNSERKSDAAMEELQPDDWTREEAPSAPSPGPATNTDTRFESVDEATRGMQVDQNRLENLRSDQLLESVAKSIVAPLNEEASEPRGGDGENPSHVTGEVTVEENQSLSVKSEAKRRKMGSTRRSLPPRREGEALRGEQGGEGEAAGATRDAQGTNSGALETEDSESTPPRAIVVETVERSNASESQSRVRPPAEEDQLAHSSGPHTAATSPPPGLMSETAAGGRRRKLGSHRKSRGCQRSSDQIPGCQETAGSQTEAGESGGRVLEAAQGTSPSLDKISEDEGGKETPSNTSAAKAAQQPEALSAKPCASGSAAQHPSAGRPGRPGSQQTLSLEHSGGEALPSKSYNVILIGDSSVGKTSFMKRVQTGRFSLDLPASVGTDSCISCVLVDGKRVALQLWDTAGQERFHSITRQIFHKAQAFLLMYDITSSLTFTDVSYWANCIQESASDDVAILLLANKSDSAARQVQSQEGEILAKEYNFQFLECSAATGHNVSQSLECVARLLCEKCDMREEATLLRQEPPKKKSSGCC